MLTLLLLPLSHLEDGELSVGVFTKADEAVMWLLQGKVERKGK